MGFVLDSIIKIDIINAESVNANFDSDSVCVDNIEESYAVQISWENGSSVNMELSLYGSVEGSNWAKIVDSDQPIINNSDVHIWNVQNSAVPYIRIHIEVSAGSADFTAILSGKRRH